MNQSRERDCKLLSYFFLILDAKRTKIEELGDSLVGETILMQARIQSSRVTGAKMTFLVMRQRTSTVQALVVVDENISKQMVKYAAK